MRLTLNYYLNKISKEDLLEKYEKENLSFKECMNYFNISQAIFFKLLKYYNIHKTNESRMQRIKNTKLERYGDCNFNNQEQRAQTNIEKYGVDNQFKRPELFPSIYEKHIERYGSYNNIKKNRETRIKNSGSLKESYKKGTITYKNTCMKRYGVPNASQLQETKNKIRVSLNDTFREVYGADYYWALPDAKRSNGSKNSHANLEFEKLLQDNNINYEREFLLQGKYYDFKVNNNLIEINPTATHNSTWSPYDDAGIDINYHKLKSELAIKNNYRCIHIYDWDDKNKIINLLKSRESIGARKCTVKDVSFQEAQNFINTNHIQGYARDSIRLGLYYSDTLVSIMTFAKPRYTKKYQYELIRYCTSINITGGANKLFNAFIKQYKPDSIISYCDESKFKGDIYLKLGFKSKSKSKPSKHWYNIKTKQHITDNMLRKLGFDRIFKTNYGKGTDNEILMLNEGFVEVYDAGQASYIWRAN